MSGEAYENGEALSAKFYASDLIFIPSPLSYIPYYIIYYYGNFNMGEKRKEKKYLNQSKHQNLSHREKDGIQWGRLNIILYLIFS